MLCHQCLAGEHLTFVVEEELAVESLTAARNFICANALDCFNVTSYCARLPKDEEAEDRLSLTEVEEQRALLFGDDGHVVQSCAE